MASEDADTIDSITTPEEVSALHVVAATSSSESQNNLESFSKSPAYNLENLRCGSHSICGSRTYNEDRVCIVPDLAEKCSQSPCNCPKMMYVAVYDGHNGEEAVDFILDNLYRNVYDAICKQGSTNDVVTALEDGFRHTDAQLLDTVLKNPYAVDEDVSQFSSGATACVCFLMGDSAFIANIGDSRCVLSREGRSMLVTKDHRSYNKEERQRVSKRNGHIDSDGYLGGVLGVTRAFGNFNSNGEKLPGLSSEPEVIQTCLRSDDEFLILACDGIFDVMNCQEVVNVVRSSLRNGADANEAARYLCELASKRQSFDNLSAALIIIKTPAPTLPKSDHPARRRFKFSPISAIVT